ncbi:uncharacterized protein PRCAT00006135001 [Priceomyces carsonii]|uniref:uncharacterized protein n=1 Tax=Priceomyces carsonii TaxID=28549 RepID=UPI002EDAFEBF|nr:unnamed protein product [Priceomyces carsonii]
MKISNTAVLALFASSTMAAATPALNQGSTLVRRSEANKMMDLLAEFKQIEEKRQLASGDEHMELSKRADNVIVNLLSAVINSGIIGEVWDTLSTNSAFRSEVVTVSKAILKTLLAEGPALIKTIWDSGLLKNILSTLLKDSDLKSAIFDAVKASIGTVLALVEKIIANKTGSSAATTTTTSATVATTTAAAKKRDIVDLEYLSKRDASDILAWVYNEVKSSGLVSKAIDSIKDDPSKYISLAESLGKTALSLGTEFYSYAKKNGLLEEIVDYLGEHGGTYGSDISKLLDELLGSNSSSSSSSGSTTTASVADDLFATLTSGTGSDATGLAAASAAAAALTDDSYATTLVKRRSY